MMRRVRSQDTSPEARVRVLLEGLTIPFHQHDPALPGRPDFVLPRQRIALFVHGCFWHQHASCPRAKRPASNVEFWDRKLNDNVSRDRRHARRLRADGWHVLTLWECRIPDANGLLRRLNRCYGTLMTRARQFKRMEIE